MHFDLSTLQIIDEAGSVEIDRCLWEGPVVYGCDLEAQQFSCFFGSVVFKLIGCHVQTNSNQCSDSKVLSA